jgi:lipopolysaccharide transport system permease protein
VVHIGPARSWASLNLTELVEYRELLYFLVWRDIKVRYKQTALGVLWALLQPLFMMLVFTLFFGRLGKLPSDGLPYSVFTLCALLPWQLFSHALTESATAWSPTSGSSRRSTFPGCSCRWPRSSAGSRTSASHSCCCSR